MLPRRHPHRPRLESGIQLRDPAAHAADVESDEAPSPEDEKRRREYAAWLARFESGTAAA